VKRRWARRRAAAPSNKTVTPRPTPALVSSSRLHPPGAHRAAGRHGGGGWRHWGGGRCAGTGAPGAGAPGAPTAGWGPSHSPPHIARWWIVVGPGAHLRLGGPAASMEKPHVSLFDPLLSPPPFPTSITRSKEWKISLIGNFALEKQ